MPVLTLSALACSEPFEPTSQEDGPVASVASALTPNPRLATGTALGSTVAGGERTYMTVRSLPTLERLGVAADLLALGSSIDRLQQSGLPDQLLTAEEIVLAERNGVLLPSERALLPRLWSVFELSDVTELAASGTLADVANFARPRFDDPALDRIVSVPIGNLATDLQATARRIQELSDVDDDRTTLGLGDIELAQQRPGGFLPEEVALFPRIFEAARAHSVARTPTKRFYLDVTAPGQTTTTAGPLGAGAIVVRSTLSFAERALPRLTLTAEGSLRVGIDAPSGTEPDLVAVDGTTGRVLNVAELWENGARVAQKLVHCTQCQEERISLEGHYELLAGGRPLFRNAKSDTEAVFESTERAPGFNRALPPSRSARGSTRSEIPTDSPSPSLRET